jgi:hypothetical protein
MNAMRLYAQPLRTMSAQPAPIRPLQLFGDGYRPANSFAVALENTLAGVSQLQATYTRALIASAQAQAVTAAASSGRTRPEPAADKPDALVIAAPVPLAPAPRRIKPAAASPIAAHVEVEQPIPTGKPGKKGKDGD